MKAIAAAIQTESASAVPLHVLPALPYAYAALEPFIDARTMTLHHDQHHAGYVKALNDLLAPYPALRRRTAHWLLENPQNIPQAIRTAVLNNAGGHVNHCLLWQSMCVPGGTPLSGSLAAAINTQFGNLDQFKSRFEAAGVAHFGVGWVWLVVQKGKHGKSRDESKEKDDADAGLQILTTSGHENPLQQGHYPLLVNDVWEHAYYLHHENRRKAYLQQWWSVANWNNAMDRYARSDNPAGAPSEDNFPMSQS